MRQSVRVNGFRYGNEDDDDGVNGCRNMCTTRKCGVIYAGVYVPVCVCSNSKYMGHYD